MTEYLPSLQTYLYVSASVYFTYITGVSIFNKIKYYYEDKRWAKIIAAQEAKEEKVVA